MMKLAMSAVGHGKAWCAIRHCFQSSADREKKSIKESVGHVSSAIVCADRADITVLF